MGIKNPNITNADPGAGYKGRRESDDVLKLSLRVGAILSANGESVNYTRTSDVSVSLTQRSNMENNGSYDYFVSIHRNAVGAEVARGVETYIYNGSYQSKETCRSLASKINNNLVAVGFIDRKVKEQNLHVVRETRCPAVLTEVGFIDHTEDNKLFDAKFEEIAQGIAKGCLAQVGKGMSNTGSSNSGSNSSNSSNNSGELYRIRKTWADAASQIGAYSSLDNAKALCDKNPGYSVFNSAGTKVYPVSASTPPTSSKQYLNLKPHMSKWNVYPLGKAPVSGNQCGTLAPSQFGGLSYEILGNPQTDVYTIQTESFGKVNIYAPRDNDSTITSSPAYGGNSAPTPQASNKQYLNLKPHMSKWNVYPLGKAPVNGNQCGALAPSQFGGLSYEILGNPQTDVYTIQTGSFGKVNIYAPRDNDSTITNYPAY